MSLDLLTPSTTTPSWSDPTTYWPAMSQALAGVSGPVAAIDVSALRYNALDMVVRAGGVPIRVASKSVRIREVIDATLAIPGYHGILAFTGAFTAFFGAGASTSASTGCGGRGRAANSSKM